MSAGATPPGGAATARTSPIHERPNTMSSHRLAPASRAGLALLVGLSVAGCVPAGGSLESAYRANLASETALNAQIISDRARAQRCDRDPTRWECGRR